MASRVMRVKMARWRRHMDSLVTGFWAWCWDMLELLADMAAIVLVGALAGAGFGWGLALIRAWL